MKTLLAHEAAEILRVPKTRIYELVCQKKLPAVHIGRLIRIPEDELNAWIAKGGEPLGEIRSTLRLGGVLPPARTPPSSKELLRSGRQGGVTIAQGGR